LQVFSDAAAAEVAFPALVDARVEEPAVFAAEKLAGKLTRQFTHILCVGVIHRGTQLGRAGVVLARTGDALGIRRQGAGGKEKIRNRKRKIICWNKHLPVSADRARSALPISTYGLVALTEPTACAGGINNSALRHLGCCARDAPLAVQGRR
jgi:hypothetical protein